MQRIFGLVKEKSEKLLADGTVNRILGWQEGEFFYDKTPAVFNNADELKDFVYDDFCGANVSKYLIKETKKEGKILALLKPCDTYSYNQLIKEHRINPDNVYVIGVGCDGKIDIDKIRANGITGITSVEVDGDNVTVHTLYGDESCKKSEVLLEKCLSCKGKQHMAYDELIVDEEAEESSFDRFAGVEMLENMTPDERFEFWRKELSKCIRCNACRNVCPACSCVKCVFDNNNSGVAAKANVNTFEENMFHIIRAFHVAGRCTDCGECSRVCPQKIPLHLLNRKFIRDINSFYGEYQAGADLTTLPPLVAYTQGDIEPTAVSDKGGDN